MVEIRNLRLERKRRHRAEKDARASVNRAAFGRSRSERTTSTAETERSRRDLDAHRREAGDDTDAGEAS